MAELKHLYYIYGEERYLKNKEKKSIEEMVNNLGGFVDTIKYKEDKLTGDQLKGLAYVQATLFGGPRFILLEDCNVTEADVWIDYLPELETSNSYVVIVNEKFDARTKLSKAYKKYGEVIDLELKKDKQLEPFVMEWLASNNMTMKKSDMDYFINKVSNHMAAIEQELIKLRDYKTANNDNLIVISKEDIDTICSETVESKIFVMIGKAAKGDVSGTYKLYHDLLETREKPAKILILLTNQINTLLMIKDCLRLNMSTEDMKDKLKLNPRAVAANASIAKTMDYKRLMGLLDYGISLQRDSRTGKMTELTAMDLMLQKCFAK
ncbi:MAG: DNA polymerase III subunit delta [Lachnospiraceae bacterium]|nr:DNA polymerase III subunit delta [Lachnospiraceae bacterium]